MAKLEFGEWLWNWYDKQPDDIKEHFEIEVIGGDWLGRQPAREQIQILTGAPDEFIQKVMTIIKPEVAVSLGHNPFMKRS